MTTKRIPCVYKITNTVNGKIYIGSAGNSTGFIGRKNYHLYMLRRNTHNNSYLQSSWLTHGEAAFKFEIVEDLTGKTDTEIHEREQWHLTNSGCLDKNLGYNIFTGPTGASMPQEIRDKISVSKLGNSLSESHKAAISRGGRGLKKPEGFGATRAGSKNGRARPFGQFTLDGKLIKVFNCIKDAMEELGIKSYTGLWTSAKDPTKRAYGFRWRYMD